MNVGSIVNHGTRAFHRGVLLTRKYSPQILTTVGVVSSVTSTVLASKATLDLEPIIDELTAARELAAANKGDAKLGAADLEGYGERQYVAEVAHAYARASLKLGKLYLPAIVAGGVGIGCLVGSHNIMQNRNAGLVAAYTLLDKSFSQYRKRVEEEFGPDMDKTLRYGLSEQRIDDTVNGTVSQVLRVDDPTDVSGYAKFFDELNPNWNKSPEYNLYFIRAQQQNANDLLRARGHVFLNEVYDALGMPRTQAGSVVGWVRNPDGTSDGDGYIDFGLYKDDERNREFINGFERSILLDFNVDGLIWNKI